MATRKRSSRPPPRPSGVYDQFVTVVPERKTIPACRFARRRMISDSRENAEYSLVLHRRRGRS
jgi:hypothetical protein